MMRCLIQLRKIEDAIEILESLNDELLQNEEILKISQGKWYYDADLKKVEFNRQITSDGVVFDIIGYLNRENLTFKWNNSKKIAASCSVLNSNEDPYEILNIELEKLIKIQKNKNKI